MICHILITVLSKNCVPKFMSTTSTGQKARVLRCTAYTQTVMQNMVSTFVGGWVFKHDILAWQFGIKLKKLQFREALETRWKPFY